MARRHIRLLTAAVVIAAGSGLWAAWPERPEPASEPLAPYHQGLSLRRTFETFPAGGAAALSLYSDNTEAWVERWRLLASAEKSIDASYFILHEDVFGLSFLGHVLERARSGVSVRMLLDALGTKMSRELAGNGYLEELAASERVELRTYRPLWRRWTEGLLTLRPSAIVASEHDKIIVVDGHTSLIGGRNIAHEYFAHPQPGNEAFKDADLRIRSDAVAAALTRAFEHQFASEDAAAGSEGSEQSQERSAELRLAYEAMDAWLRGDDLPLREHEQDFPWLQELRRHPQLRGAWKTASREPVRAETRILDSHTRFNAPDDQITEALLRLAGAARREIFAQTPYVVLSEAGVKALEDAAARGVAITIVTNSPVSSDNALSQAFFLEQWPEIMARVPTLRLFVAGRAHNLHAKSVTFDGELAMVGTYNLDPISMAFNSEVMAASWSRELAKDVEAPARRAIARGAPELYEYRIRRDEQGRALRDEDGRIAIAFGPRDHCTPEEWAALGAYWTVLKAAKEFVGFSPIL